MPGRLNKDQTKALSDNKQRIIKARRKEPSWPQGRPNLPQDILDRLAYQQPQDYDDDDDENTPSAQLLRELEAAAEEADRHPPRGRRSRREADDAHRAIKTTLAGAADLEQRCRAAYERIAQIQKSIHSMTGDYYDQISEAMKAEDVLREGGECSGMLQQWFGEKDANGNDRAWLEEEVLRQRREGL